MELILGTAQLAGRYGVMATQRESRARALAILRAARGLGIQAVDTAPAYAGAESAIGTEGAGFAVHTKLPPGVEPVTALAASLERLRRERVDVVYLHDPDAVLDVDEANLDTAARLVGNGADALGSSIYTREQFVAAGSDPRVTVVQAPISVLDRSIDDEDLRRASASGTRVIARSVLLQGLLADPERAVGRVPALDAALAEFAATCHRAGRAPLEVAIGWVRARPGVTGIVLGAETPEQLVEVARAFAAPVLPDDLLGLLASLPQPLGRAADPRTWPRR